jgi:signal transduction histidine kinase
VHQTVWTPEDVELANKIDRDYAEYRGTLHLDKLPISGTIGDLAQWSDSHHMGELIDVCRELADRQRARMQDGLERSEVQTAWAERVLLALGIGGVLSGLMSGYVTARSLNRRVAQLSFRVQAVRAHLDQEVGTMTLQENTDLNELDSQLDRVIERVNSVCLRVRDQESDLRRAEHLATVGQLAAGVAHEIRNPLTGVKLLLQGAVRPHNATALTPDRLHLMLQEVGRIERTVQGLMDFAGAPPLDRREQDINVIVAEAAKVAQSRAEIRSIAIRLDLGQAPLTASVDHDRFLSLLTNLLFNAIDATPTGGEVLASAQGDATGIIKVTVIDAGPGISEAAAKNLFEPFATGKVTGTGLGLTVAKRIAEEHGGSLVAAERSEGGACFTLTIPAKEHL